LSATASKRREVELAKLNQLANEADVPIAIKFATKNLMNATVTERFDLKAIGFIGPQYLRSSEWVDAHKKAHAKVGLMFDSTLFNSTKTPTSLHRRSR
jgi:hypothetical protein